VRDRRLSASRQPVVEVALGRLSRTGCAPTEDLQHRQAEGSADHRLETPPLCLHPL